MDSLLEKITLYDILGYMVPGSFFMILVILPMDPQTIVEYSELIEKISTLFILIMLISAYVCGLVLSEVSRWIRSRHVFSLFDSFPKTVERKKLIEALEESKLVDKEDLPENVKIGRFHYRLMYGIVQTDNKYKRIHNYASAAILYKNLAAASLSSIVMRYMIWGKCILRYESICFGVAVIFLIRMIRFEKKVGEYTVVFFVEKYISAK